MDMKISIAGGTSDEATVATVRRHIALLGVAMAHMLAAAGVEVEISWSKRVLRSVAPVNLPWSTTARQARPAPTH